MLQAATRSRSTPAAIIAPPGWGAARGIARRLREHGDHAPETAGFIVEYSDGPLRPGEIERAHAWAVGHRSRVARALAAGARP
jgi:hypothetical protein